MTHRLNGIVAGLTVRPSVIGAEELADIGRRLKSPNWRFRLQRVQDIVFREFRKLQDDSTALTIRTIVPRRGLKSLDSVLRKIEDHRARGDRAYGFDDVDDFVGVKVLCPYPTDVRQVIRWMRAHPGFVSTPERDEHARHDKAFGYRGYHYGLQLAGALLESNDDLASLRCEVQIKTMLEEAWDAKTHGLSYKREEDIDPDLLLRIKQLSDALQLLDRQSETVKTEIARQQRQQRAKIEANGRSPE